MAGICGTTGISERHLDKVDIARRGRFAGCDLRISGLPFDARQPEIVEISDRPRCPGKHVRPELKSRPFAPHPLFAGSIRTTLRQSRLV